MRSGSIQRAVHAPASAEPDAESRALHWFKARRLIVVGADPIATRALAETLRANGASVAVVGSLDRPELEAAHALDADAVLVDATELAGSCQPIVAELVRHPRVRWATVVEVTPTAEGADAGTLAAIAAEVGKALAPAVELAVRAKGKLPYETRLEPLGLNRMLRLLADTRRALHVELSGEWGRAAVELGEEGRIIGAETRFAQPAEVLTNAEALAGVLGLSSAQVRITTGAATRARKWNLNVTAALQRAAAIEEERLRPPPPSERDAGVEPADAPAGEEPPARPSVLPTMPQIVLAEVLPDVELGLLAREEQLDLDPAPAADGGESGTRQRSDLAVTREFSLAEAAVEAPVDAAPEPARRGRGRIAGWAGVAVLAAALLVGLGPRLLPNRARRESTRAGTAQKLVGRAPAAAVRVDLPVAAPAPSAQAAEPASSAVESDSTLQRPQRPGQLEQAKLLVKQARHLRRAGKLEEARATYLSALDRLASYPLALAGLVRIELERKNGAEAVHWASQLVLLQPDRAANQLLLGDAQALQGDRSAAEQAWRRAIDLGSKTARQRLR